MKKSNRYLGLSRFLAIVSQYEREHPVSILYYCWRKDSTLNFFTFLDRQTKVTYVAHICRDETLSVLPTMSDNRKLKPALTASTASTFITLTDNLSGVIFNAKERTIEYDLEDASPLTIDLNESNHSLFV